jgi:hypothetical protein
MQPAYPVPKYSLQRYAAICGIFLVPTVAILLLGLSFIYTRLVRFLGPTIDLFFPLIIAIGIGAIIQAIIVRMKNGRPTRQGLPKPFWLTTMKIYTFYEIIDVMAVAVLAILARTSDYPYPLPMFFLGILIPVVFLGGYIYRSSILGFLSPEFFIPVGEEDAKIWVLSSVSRVFLTAQNRRGLFYLEQCMKWAQREYARDQRIPKEFNDAVDLIRMLSRPNYDVPYDRILRFVNRAFPLNGGARLDNLALECGRLVHDRDTVWITQTQPLAAKKKPMYFLTVFAHGVQKFIQPISVGAVFAAFVLIIKYVSPYWPAVGKSLESVGQSHYLTLGVVIALIVVATSVIPAVRFHALLSVAIDSSDLRDYSRDYDRAIVELT